MFQSQQGSQKSKKQQKQIKLKSVDFKRPRMTIISKPEFTTSNQRN